MHILTIAFTNKTSPSPSPSLSPSPLETTAIVLFPSKVGVVTFDDEAEVRIQLKRDANKCDLIDYMNGFTRKSNGWTNINAGNLLASFTAKETILHANFRQHFEIVLRGTTKDDGKLKFNFCIGFVSYFYCIEMYHTFLY